MKMDEKILRTMRSMGGKNIDPFQGDGEAERDADRRREYGKAAWKITELSTGHFIAEATEDNTLCYPERRVYFSRHSLEQDFGQP